jgi:hypothetical protein
MARSCSAGTGSAVLSAARLLLESEERRAAVEQSETLLAVPEPDLGAGWGSATGPSDPSEALVWGKVNNGGTGSRGEKRRSRMILSLALLLFLAFGAAFALVFAGEGERAPALDRAGGSRAGEDAVHGASLAAMDRPAEEASGRGGGGDQVEDLALESAAVSQPHGTEPAAGGARETGETDTQADALPLDPSPAPPVASFSLSPGEGQSPLRVYLDASSSYDPDGSIASYRWSCGGSGKCLYHIFESNVIPTVVSITLTVTDNGGHSSSATRYVTLY